MIDKTIVYGAIGPSSCEDNDYTRKPIEYYNPSMISGQNLGEY
jgi:hypothetical protein